MNVSPLRDYCREQPLPQRPRLVRPGPQGPAYNSAVMTRQFQLALLLALLTALPAGAQTAPIEAKQALINIQHDGSEGDVRVNGVLILHFSSDPKLGKGSLTDSLGGKAPIQAASKELAQDDKPKWRWEIGSYWMHRPDGWFVTRQ